MCNDSNCSLFPTSFPHTHTPHLYPSPEPSSTMSKAGPSSASDDNFLPSQYAGLLTSQRIFNDRQESQKAAALAAAAAAASSSSSADGVLVLVTPGGGFKSSMAPPPHWAETPDMPYPERQRVRALPTSYNRESAMRLVPAGQVDTTDTSLRLRAGGKDTNKNKKAFATVEDLEAEAESDTNTTTTTKALSSSSSSSSTAKAKAKATSLAPSSSQQQQQQQQQQQPQPQPQQRREAGKASDASRRALLDLNLRFDTAGFKDDPLGGLQRDVYYISPYLTCEECNNMVYIDAAALRSRINLPTLSEQVPGVTLPMEPLPPCPGCNRTNTFRIGADDLTLLLAGNAEELARRKRVQRKMSIKLQRCYRYYLARRYGRAQRHAIIIRNMLEARCCKAIQAMARGRMARRRAVVEVALVVIKKANNLLLERALNPKLYQKRVFWYKTKTELSMIYGDYYVLVERTGHTPPVCVVEENIKEIARRIIEREGQLATRVQARWRAICVRRYITVFRLEVCRAREIVCASVFRIQRVFRGWKGRKKKHFTVVQKLKARLLDEYQTERFKKGEKVAIKGASEKLRAYYTKERQEERSARMTGLVNPKLSDGKKMKAFHESSYGYDSVQQLMDDFMEDVTARKERDDALEAEKRQRAEWVMIEQNKGLGQKHYFEDEMVARREGIVKRLTKERPIRNVAAMLMGHNSKGIKFQYPNVCYSDPLSILKEEIVVSTIRRDANGRRLRSDEELEELKKYDKSNVRRGGVTIESMRDKDEEKQRESKRSNSLTRQSSSEGPRAGSNAGSRGSTSGALSRSSSVKMTDILDEV